MKHFTYKTLSELQSAADQAGAHNVVFEENAGKVRQTLARPVQVGDLRVGNSMAIHPMEGCDGTLDGRPDELTIRRYHRFAAGGAKLIWFEATAVREDGRANTRQLWIHEGNVDDYARLNDEILDLHRKAFGTADDVLMPVQLTHSGRYSVPRKTIAYHNPLIDKKSNTPPDYPVITDDELERLEDDFVKAAGLVLKAGFCAIDMKAVHGYLINEMMGAKTSEGRYRGPSLENRTRFVRNVLGKLRAAYGRKLRFCMRLNAFDSVPYLRNAQTGIGEPYPYDTPYAWGWGNDPNDPLKEDLTEVKQAITWFRQDGVELFNISLGSPYFNPHVGRPFEKPDDGNYEEPEHPLMGVNRHFRIAGELQQTFPDLPIVGTGYSWLQKYAINAAARNIAEGKIRFFGLGRGVLSYPDFAKDALEKGELDELRVCKTLTYCTFLMRQKNHPLGQFPAGCPPFDKEGYGPIMKEARAAQRAALSQIKN
jgi:2,4-dienoyl-CoA reductase-like NADH-dependent reductase (Old Yellow Enzyme family)